MIEENHEKISQVGRHRDLTPGPPECESRALPRSQLAWLQLDFFSWVKKMHAHTHTNTKKQKHKKDKPKHKKNTHIYTVYIYIYIYMGRRLILISESLIWSKTLMELIFNSCSEFRLSPEGPVSQIHCPHLHAGTTGFFSDLSRSVQMLKRVGCGKQREASAPIHS